MASYSWASSTLLDVKNVKEFCDFKGKFEWLERKFGLKPT